MSTRQFLGDVHRIKGEVISWAGICPWHETPAFGTDAGDILITPGAKGGRKVRRDAFMAKTVQEAVNSVAFLEQFTAVSTRSEIKLLKRQASKIEDLGDRVKISRDTKLYPFGAHNIIAIPSQNSFLAAGNMDGVYFFVPDEERVVAGRILCKENKCPISKIADAGRQQTGNHLITGACRSNGVVAFEYAYDQTQLGALYHDFGGLDVIDIFPVNHRTVAMPRAAVALGADGTLLFIPDLIGKEPPLTLAPGEDLGDVYGLLVVDQSVLVLTHDRLFCLPDVIKSWGLDGLSPQREVIAVQIKDAVDLLTFGSHGFAVLDADRTMTFDLRQFVRSANKNERFQEGRRNKFENRYSKPLSARFDVGAGRFSPSKNHWEVRTGTTLGRVQDDVSSFSRA